MQPKWRQNFTPPTKPYSMPDIKWFTLKVDSKAAENNPTVKLWLDDVADRIHSRIDIKEYMNKAMEWPHLLMHMDGNVVDRAIPPEEFYLSDKDFTIDFNLTRGVRKGVSMNYINAACEARRPGDIRGPVYEEEKPMTLKRYRQISDLSYKLKAVIDKEIKDLKPNEACMLGEMMQRIINLK